MSVQASLWASGGDEWQTAKLLSEACRKAPQRMLSSAQAYIIADMAPAAMSHFLEPCGACARERSRAEPRRQAAHREHVCTDLRTHDTCEGPQVPRLSGHAGRLERAMSHRDTPWKNEKNAMNTQWHGATFSVTCNTGHLFDCLHILQYISSQHPSKVRRVVLTQCLDTDFSKPELVAFRDDCDSVAVLEHCNT